MSIVAQLLLCQAVILPFLALFEDSLFQLSSEHPRETVL